jgi:hypothetical protein
MNKEHVGDQGVDGVILKLVFEKQCDDGVQTELTQHPAASFFLRDHKTTGSLKSRNAL